MDTTPPPSDESRAQAERALRAIRNMDHGADPGAEAFALSNDFTDRQLERLRGLWRRRKPDRPS